MWLRTEGLDAVQADAGMRPLLTNPALTGPLERVRADREGVRRVARATGRGSSPTSSRRPPARCGRPRARALARPGRCGGRLGAGPLPVVDRHRRIEDAGARRLPRGGSAARRVAPAGQLRATSGRARAEALVEGLLLRVMSYFRPGLVQLHVWDVGQFTGALPGLYPLTRTGLLTVHDPAMLPQLLDELSARIRRVHTRLLVDGHPSLRALAERRAARNEPWIVAVLFGNRAPLKDDEQRQLQRVARGGLACGVAGAARRADDDQRAGRDRAASATTRRHGATSMTGPHVTVDLEPPLPPAEVTRASHADRRRARGWRSRIGTFADVLPPTRAVGRPARRRACTRPSGSPTGCPWRSRSPTPRRTR